MNEDTAVVEEIGRLLNERRLTVATAESCTGGLIGQRLTSVSGSSTYFAGGIIAYSNEIKTRLLRVQADLIENEGAVSAAVAGCMADSVREIFKTDIGIGVTGIAGPQGGTPNKPVGLVFIGYCRGGQCQVQRHVFKGDRKTIRESACSLVLQMLKENLLERK